MIKRKNIGMVFLIVVIMLPLTLFVVLYRQTRVPVDVLKTEFVDSALSDWTLEESVVNGAPLKEDKSIYGEPDNSIIVRK